MSEIDETYHKLLNDILKNGFKYEDPNRKDINRYQIPHYTIKHNLKDGFPAITTKKLYWKGVVGELLWFLKGDTNIKYLVDNGINIWNKDAYNYECKKTIFARGKEQWLEEVKKNNYGNLGRIYGAQWRNWRGSFKHSGNENKVDQISNLIKNLKEKPLSTEHIVTAWNPADLDNMALPPCHWSFEILVEPIPEHQYMEQWYEGVEEGDFRNDSPTKEDLDNYNIPQYQFTLKWHQRSVDTFLGLPFNIASYALLAHIIGKMTNMIPKGIIGDLSNVHIYEPHLDAVKEQLSRDVRKYDKCELEINSEINNILSGKIKNQNINLDTILNNIGIPDFNLYNYESYPAINVEMLSRD